MSGLSLLSSWLSHQPLLSLALTLAAYEAGSAVSRRFGSPLANPVLIAILLIAPVLLATGTSYETYFESARFVNVLLGPATVALAIPLYANIVQVKRAAASVIAGVAAGAVTASASAVAIAWALGASDVTQLSIAPKSVTVPIAIAVSQQIGGAPELTAVLVILTGICGAVLSTVVLDRIGIRCWRVRGLATGVAAHGIGTARILAMNETGGAFASLGMGLCGLTTAIALPLAAHWLGAVKAW
jgi:predicted murein hydrolase (TIGR00659 family)